MIILFDVTMKSQCKPPTLLRNSTADNANSDRFKIWFFYFGIWLVWPNALLVHFFHLIAHKLDTRTLNISGCSRCVVHNLVDLITTTLSSSVAQIISIICPTPTFSTLNTMKLSYLLLAIATGSSVSTSPSDDRVLNAFGQESYGVDTSFPVHYLDLNKEDNPLGDRQKFYDEFMDGCREHYGGKRGSTACDVTEEDRVAMSLRQPASMQVSTEERHVHYCLNICIRSLLTHLSHHLPCIELHRHWLQEGASTQTSLRHANQLLEEEL